MRLLRWLFGACLLTTFNTLAATWQPAGEVDRREISPDLVYVQRTAIRPADGRRVSAHLALFTSRAFRLEVVDLGSGPEAADRAWTEAFRSAGCLAGVNGGFFHPDRRPLGLMIAGGRRINRFETARLLSGVVYSDDRGIHLVRRAQFRDHPGIKALLQSGPYLVDGGRAVRGLSTTGSDRRTFIATDWRGHWVLGATSSPVSLAELAECLVAPGVLTPWTTARALNLDGGSSSGFFFEPGAGEGPVVLAPWKRVRNLLGIAPR